MAKKTRQVVRRAARKPPTNGHTNGAIKLPPEQIEQLRGIDSRMVALKISLADVALQQNALRHREQQIIAALEAANTELQELGATVTAPHKKSDNETWRVNMLDMTISKTA